MRSLALILLATGCTVQPPPKPPAPAVSAPVVIVKHDFCEEAKPIYLTKKDKLDASTVDAILSHNRRGVTLCGWKP